MDHSLGASGTSSALWPRVLYQFFFIYSFFLNVAVHLSFTLSIPPSFPVSSLLWVTDTQGKMCVCCCVQAGCYCHQEQSHLLPNTRCAADRKTGQGKKKKTSSKHLLLNTHFRLVAHKTQKCSKYLGKESPTSLYK